MYTNVDSEGHWFTPTGVGTIEQSSAPATASTVHPHGRGDNQFSTRVRTGTCGSPPRAWGQSNDVLATGAEWRFTPTGVGTIESPMTSSSYESVHPHGRGDNGYPRADRALLCGSPPRAWGQSVIRRDTRLRSRFTPTGVGTIRDHTWLPDSQPVHPHGRGDNNRSGVYASQCVGSPPRAWGQ